VFHGMVNWSIAVVTSAAVAPSVSVEKYKRAKDGTTTFAHIPYS
jgi:hypothetical protein